MENERLLSNIRELCKKDEISITNLEKKLGFGAGTISRWNKASPSIDKLVDIAQYFKVSIDFLMGYKVYDDQFKTTTINDEAYEIVQYLIHETNNMQSSKKFWFDYFQEIGSLRFQIVGIEETDSNESKIFFAYDEDGYYLFKVKYYLNEFYDYETQLQLYLMPDEGTPPVLECDDKVTLQPLYIDIMSMIETEQKIKTTQEKIGRQRANILEKYRKIKL